MNNSEKSGVIIAIGSGGVGKTTVASALGLYYAKRGHRTLVITIDPARRLLDAMGIKACAEEPCRVDMEDLVDGGELHVFMPNLKKEWASFLQAAIAHADVRHKIASNHFYQYMADGMPGALEIISSHILFRILASDRFDKIILDTPPTSHSISFFDVPQRIARVLEQGVFRALMSRRNSMLLKLTRKLAFFSGGILQNTFERIIGSHFFSELIDFALSIDALYEPLLHRVREMDKLLKSATTTYVLVVKPTMASVKDSAYVKTALHERGIAINEIIINQVMPVLDQGAIDAELRMFAQSEQGQIRLLIDLYGKEVALEKNLIAALLKEFPDKPCRLLFMTEATVSRTTQLLQMVANLEQGVS
jgi:anion-transporting  ArsA/GET3 family ATPase